jgi:DNA topoisomerase-2
VVGGFATLGRDRYGVLPIRGKLLNCLDAKAAQIAKNEEIAAIFEAMGIEPGKTYTDVSPLRYGSIMWMTDADPDGIHIQMLCIGMLFETVPSLLKLPKFVSRFETYVIILKRGKPGVTTGPHRYEERGFMLVPEFKEFEKNECDGDVKAAGWEVKWIKGLGTLETKDAKKWFANIKKHRVYFKYTGKPCDDAIRLALGDDADARKAWIAEFSLASLTTEGFDASYKAGSELTFRDFVYREYILYAIEDNLRMIPDIIDGFKPVSTFFAFSVKVAAKMCFLILSEY